MIWHLLNYCTPWCCQLKQRGHTSQYHQLKLKKKHYKLETHMQYGEHLSPNMAALKILSEIIVTAVAVSTRSRCVISCKLTGTLNIEELSWKILKRISSRVLMESEPRSCSSSATLPTWPELELKDNYNKLSRSLAPVGYCHYQYGTLFYSLSLLDKLLLVHVI